MSLLSHDEFTQIEQLLAKAEKADLSAWDADFVTDMQKRLRGFGRNTLITARQHEQLNRIGDRL